MAMSKDEAVATLKAMFDEWDMLSLADAVDMAKGNLDMACEIILSAGSVEGLRKMKADMTLSRTADPPDSNFGSVTNHTQRLDAALCSGHDPSALRAQPAT